MFSDREFEKPSWYQQGLVVSVVVSGVVIIAIVVAVAIVIVRLKSRQRINIIGIPKSSLNEVAFRNPIYDISDAPPMGGGGEIGYAEPAANSHSDHLAFDGDHDEDEA